MAYIIESANLLKESGLEKMSILIKNERIEAINPSLRKYTHMKMNANPYIMTSPHIIYNPNVPFHETLLTQKQYYADEFIKRGCTLFLTYVNVEKESLLKTSLKRIKTNLLNSPIDFIIGVKIPVRLLTPTFIRKCKNEKIPVIFVEVYDTDELFQVPWGWIREALFPYNSPLVPVFIQEKSRKQKQAQAIWTEVLTGEKIPFIKEEIREREPIPKSVLWKIGVIPVKSYIHQGAEVSYNLYSTSREINKIEELELFLYHSHRLLITVHKGTVIRAGEEVLYRPGFGEHVIIKTPSFFTSDN